jgi:type IX secretion system PorP/SprF family membrane protein
LSEANKFFIKKANNFLKIINNLLVISENLCYFMHFFKEGQTKFIIMRKNLLFLFIVFLLSGVVNAQQDAQFTQNMFNQMAINPGYAGSHDAICATALFRQQWMGFTETVNGNENKVAPQTMLFSLHSNVDAIRGGLGLVVYKDKLGYEDNIGVKFGYAYRMPLQGGTLGIGLMAGFLNKKIDFSQFNYVDAGDPLLSSQNVESDMVFDLAFGAYYNKPGVFYAGLSSNQLMQSQTDMVAQAANLGSPQLKRHYYLTGGYQYQLPNNPQFELRPSIFVKSDFASTQLDVNALMYYNNQFWGGLSYRMQDAIAILLGAQPFINSGNKSLETLGVGYSYDITTSAMGRSGRSSGSHEILLNYCFKIVIVIPPDSYRNVRFL